MLAACHELPLAHEGAVETETAHDLLDIIIAAFLEETRGQLRRGVLRRYQRVEDRLARPRGRLLVAEQARRGLAGATAIRCEFDELSTDNPVNRALRAAIDAIPAGLRGDTVRRSRLLYVASAIANATPTRFSSRDIRALPLDRLSARYRASLDLAAWIVQLAGPDLHGEGEQGLALLFDMNQLFESYVARFVASTFLTAPETRDMRVIAQGPTNALLKDASGRQCFSLRPDITIQRPPSTLAIIDTKWKALGAAGQATRPDVSQADVYQVLAYAAAYRCPEVYLLYPLDPLASTASRGADYFFEGPGDTQTAIRVRTFDLDEPVQSACCLRDSRIAGHCELFNGNKPGSPATPYRRNGGSVRSLLGREAI